LAGVIVAWGGDLSNQALQSDIPSGNDYIDIAVGITHALALKADGSLVAWGDNTQGQCDVPAGNDFVAIAASDWHSLALKSDGTIVGWGSPADGRLEIPAGTFTHLSSCGLHSIAIKTDGSLMIWPDLPIAPDPPAGYDFVDVDMEEDTLIARRSDGSLDTWQWSPAVPSGDNYARIASGNNHCLALKTDSSLVAWGNNDFGQCDVPSGTDYAAVAAGKNYSVALKTDGSLVQWGGDAYSTADAPAGNSYVKIAANGNTSLALADYSGEVDCSWTGNTSMYWDEINNWSPAVIPDNGTGTSFRVTLDTSGLSDTRIQLDNDRIITKLETYGNNVRMQSFGKNPGQVLLTALQGITNYSDDLRITCSRTEEYDYSDMEVYGSITNTSGKGIKIEGAKVYGTLSNEGEVELVDMHLQGEIINRADGELELGRQVLISGNIHNQDSAQIHLSAVSEKGTEIEGDLTNDGMMMFSPASLLVMEKFDNNESNLHNNGVMLIYDGRCEVAGVLQNENTGTIQGFGLLFAGTLFQNDGTIHSMADMRIGLGGLFVNSNTGIIKNAAATSINIVHVTDPATMPDVSNFGTITVNSAGGISFSAPLHNQSGGSIELLGGTLGTPHLYQGSGASFEGLGNITGDVTIESGGSMTLTGTSNIFGDVVIEAGATLEVTDGTVYIYGDLTNNGTIQKTGGHIIRKGTFTNNGAVSEQQSDSNSVSDYNLDGHVNVEDFADFAQNWLWQSQT
jgi:alpha-tubulin suppressor-like RCC1 family protein